MLARGVIIAGCHEDHWSSVIRNGGSQLPLVFESAYPGQAFVENGPTDENMVRNNGSVPAETIVTFITPPGAPIRDDAPPPGCNP